MNKAYTPDIQQFFKMLRYKRPDQSATESEFIEKFISPLDVEEDSYGNLSKLVGNPSIAWSSHTDTVHSTGGKQKLDHRSNGVVGLLRSGKSGDHSNCLGADDTSGVWLMLEMIKAGVEGLYIFHRAEERGGGGSSYIARNRAELLKETKAIIALDRKGYDEVIISQARGDGCSKEFGWAFAKKLGMGYKISERGSFTDTANYFTIVPECANLSVGYFYQHSINEVQDVSFLRLLCEKLVSTDFSDLPIVRDPAEAKLAYDYRSHSHRGDSYSTSRTSGGFDFDDDVDYLRAWAEIEDIEEETGFTADELEDMNDIEQLVWEYPDAVARILIQNGYTCDDIMKEAITILNEEQLSKSKLDVFGCSSRKGS